MRILGAAMGVVLAAAACVRQKPATSSSVHNSATDLLCPTGTDPYAVGNSGGAVCANERDILGPFPLAQVGECQTIAGFTSASRSACEADRWLRRFALDLRGTGRCPKGTLFDAVTNLCVEEIPGHEATVYGPFPKDLVEKCQRALPGTPLCLAQRWERRAVLEWLGISLPRETTPPALDNLRKFPWPEGSKPPQFVLLSFDGTGEADQVRWLRDLARTNAARFTHFLSGVYFLYPETAHNYTPPKARRGLSNIGFNFPSHGLTGPRVIEGLVAELNTAFAEGDEMATHFNGHFCGAGGVEAWTSADWKHEVDEFRKIVINSHRINGFSTKVSFSASDIRGSRAPCLEGRSVALYPALQELGFSYDASTAGSREDWPTKDQGLWRMPLAQILLADGTGEAVAQDFHLCHQINGCEPITDTRTLGQIEERTYRSYMAYYNDNFASGRAPVHIGHHSTLWHGGVYRKALARFATDVCKRPDTYCVTYQELVGFLETYANRFPQRTQTPALPIAAPASDRHTARSQPE